MSTNVRFIPSKPCVVDPIQPFGESLLELPMMDDVKMLDLMVLITE